MYVPLCGCIQRRSTQALMSLHSEGRGASFRKKRAKHSAIFTLIPNLAISDDLFPNPLKSSSGFHLPVPRKGTPYDNVKAGLLDQIL
jgi:hypothetical protein